MQKPIVIFLIMLFMHIVDDYYLQGVLAKMKQRKWWKENAPDQKYSKDYIAALIAHAFSWSFLICLPWTYLALTTGILNQYEILAAIILNTVIHSVVDDAKANKLSINLIVDQSIHLVQIIITFIVFYLTM